MEEYCKNCGAKVKPDEDFCPDCGSKIERNTITCENCGASLRKGMKFCTECGHATREKVNFCDNCGRQISEDEEFCSECGQDIAGNADRDTGRFADKSRIAIVTLVIIIMTLALFIAVPIITDLTAGSQHVFVGTAEFKIPDYFEYDEKASNKTIDERITHKDWRHGDEHIEIAVSHFASGADIDKVLVNLGGYKEEKYNIRGHHYHFQDGEECFAYDAGGNRMISIIVSDAKLFDKIEVL